MDLDLCTCIIPVARQSAAKKFSWYLILRGIHVGSAEQNYPTMTAVSAEGDPFPDRTTMVSPPAPRENTWASSADLPTPDEPPDPIRSPYGTQTTIEPTIANSPSQHFDDPRQHPHHHDRPFSVLPPRTPCPIFQRYPPCPFNSQSSRHRCAHRKGQSQPQGGFPAPPSCRRLP